MCGGEVAKNGGEFLLRFRCWRRLLSCPFGIAVFSAQPVQGCVFFESAIKPRKIKSAEIYWTGLAGEHLGLKLR